MTKKPKIASDAEPSRIIRVMPHKAATQRKPLPAEVCIAITDADSTVDDPCDTVLSISLTDKDLTCIAGSCDLSKARAVLDFAARHRNHPITVRGETGTSKSTAIGLWLAAWLHRPLAIEASEALTPNPNLVEQLKAAASPRAFLTADVGLMKCMTRGITGLQQECPSH